MQKAGCFAVFFGVESGVQEMLDRMKRARTLESIRQIFQNASKAGLVTVANVIFGFPGETRETMQETLNFVKELDADHAMFFKAIPYSKYSFEELDKIERHAYKEFYLRKSYHVKRLIRLIPLALKRKARFNLCKAYVDWLFRAMDYVASL
jgi:radical SAM superfamily enzyme YgiQ (UPF0313 family)